MGFQITNSLQPIFQADLHDFRFMTRSKEVERKLITAIIISTKSLDVRVNDIDKNAGEVIKAISKISLQTPLSRQGTPYSSKQFSSGQT